jgi:hypothetical protein
MKNVKLKFNDTSVDVFDDGWLCICDGENQIFLRPEYFKKLLEALTTPVVVGQSEQLPVSLIPEFGSDEWINCCKQMFGGKPKNG